MKSFSVRTFVDMYFNVFADDGVSSAVIEMEYFKRSSTKFQRFLVSEKFIMSLFALKVRY